MVGTLSNIIKEHATSLVPCTQMVQELLLHQTLSLRFSTVFTLHANDYKEKGEITVVLKEHDRCKRAIFECQWISKETVALLIYVFKLLRNLGKICGTLDLLFHQLNNSEFWQTLPKLLGLLNSVTHPGIIWQYWNKCKMGHLTNLIILVSS